MNKSTKIMITVIGVVLAVCITIIAIVSVTNSRNNDAPDEPSSSDSVSVINETTLSQSQQNQSSQPETSANSQGESTTASTTSSDLSEKIIGKWMDDANMSGFEFKKGNSVTVTYVNLTVPVVNFPINGSASGTYVLNGNNLTINFSIYTKTITHEYTAYVENDVLTLVEKEDSETATYKKVSSSSEESSTIPSGPAESGGIYGSWKNNDDTVKYTCNQSGIVNLEFSSAAVLGQKFTGNCNGVFIINGDKLTIQYTILSQQITDEYTFSVSNNSMKLLDSHGNSTIFIRAAGASSGDSVLIGKWSDSSGMSGYEFKENGVVEVTYVNFTVPVVNMPINGSYTGSYTVNGNNLSVSVSIYSRTIKDDYTFSVDGNILTLTDKKDSKVSTYTKQN